MGNIYSAMASGLGSSAAYQVAGRPYLTGSNLDADEIVNVSFPTVTRSFTLVNTGSANIRMYFIDPSVSNDADEHKHRLTLSPNSSFTMDVKCVNLYVKGVGESGFELAAELTSIRREDMYTLTGSGIG